MAAGTVVSLHRWPVKSMGGERHDSLRLDERGIDGDRLRAIFDLHRGAPRRLTIRQVPRLVLWSARHDGTLTAPDGRSIHFDDPELPSVLARDLGRAVTLVADDSLQQDLPRSVLVTTRATHEAVERELGRHLDLRRWRTNIHVDLDAGAYEEERWEGRSLRVGEAAFTLLHPCERCVVPTRDPDSAVKDAGLMRFLTRERAGLFGMNARPLGPATIRVGDRVEIS